MGVEEATESERGAVNTDTQRPLLVELVQVDTPPS